MFWKNKNENLNFPSSVTFAGYYSGVAIGSEKGMSLQQDFWLAVKASHWPSSTTLMAEKKAFIVEMVDQSLESRVHHPSLK